MTDNMATCFGLS